MKRLLFLSVTIFLLLSGCEIVETPYKKDNIIISSDRKVLLEYYTGHKCPNCPGAGKILKENQELYGDNLVVITAHAGTLARPLIPPFLYDFRTETGNEWFSYFEMEKAGVPCGLINRKERSGSKIHLPANWATVVAEQVSLLTEAEITLSASYDETTRQIKVSSTTNIAAPINGESYTLTVVLTEDSILKPQDNNNINIGPVPVIMDYAHMHVLRLSITPGHWGAPINAEIIEQKNFTKTLDIDSDIVPQNCRVVAFISNSKREVLQAEEVKLIE